VCYSSNRGTSWTTINAGLRTGYIASLAVIGSNLFAGTDGAGAFVFPSGGSFWSSAGAGLTSSTVLAFAAIGSNVFAGTQPGSPVQPGGVYLSTNAGGNWTPVSSGLGSSIVRALAVNGSTLIAGTAAGIFLSGNNGTTWSPANDGLTSISVYSLAIIGTNLFAGTFGGGVYRRPLSELTTGISVPATGSPDAFRLEQNYPNPFNPGTVIRYTLPARARVRLTVYNSLGQNVATLVDEETEPGVHDIRFDGSGLASGMYFYRLQAGSLVESKKLLLVR
jgi:hypothetical protein